MTIEAIALLILAAQGATTTDGGPACNRDKADQGIQHDLNMCAHAAFREADDALNRQWERTAAYMRQLDTQLPPIEDGRASYFDTLLASQRAWLAYRDSHCASEGYLARGGSMEPMLVSYCLAELTTERTEQLRQLAEYPE